MRELTKGALCENCQENPATGLWLGEGGTLAITRDYMQALWCERCMVEEELKHAKDMAAKVNELEIKLASLGDPEKSPRILNRHKKTY